MAQRTFREDHVEFKKSALPQSLLLPRNAAAPSHEIKTSSGGLGRFGVESERVVLSPLLSAAVG